jgi:hypothetical protein
MKCRASFTSSPTSNAGHLRGDCVRLTPYALRLRLVHSPLTQFFGKGFFGPGLASAFSFHEMPSHFYFIAPRQMRGICGAIASGWRRTHFGFALSIPRYFKIEEE